jgi:predicted RNA binding protein YcfA (HicA-like mRNA interferase family)
LKRVSGKQMCKVLSRHGWSLDHVTGSHYVFKKAGEVRNVSVPVHGNKPLKKGTQAGIMKQAGLKDSDL